MNYPSVTASVVGIRGARHKLMRTSRVVRLLALLLPPPCSSARLAHRKPTLVLNTLACLRGGGGANDFYQVLGVSKDATPNEIKRAYREKSLKTHPDRNKGANSHEQFIQVGQAYETLKDPGKRALYDQTWSQRARQRKQHDQHHTDEANHERWRPPPRSQPKEPYTMDDARKTFRSFFGHAITVLGESQLDRLLEADSPFYTVARSTWIATSLAFVLRPNATAAEREETRRAIDAGLLFCMPLLSRTVGRKNAARLLGYLALGLTPLALSRYVIRAMPTAIRRAIVGVGVCAVLWRFGHLDPDEREALASGCSYAANASIDLVAAIVGNREQSRRWLSGLALVLMPLLLARAVVAVSSVLGIVRHTAGRLTSTAATWSLGMLTAAILWFAWKIGAPEVSRTRAAPTGEPEVEAEEEETDSSNEGGG